ncbi:hypothetical protein DFJ73DRAFT_799709 [Zopfochytrium polystomum]|nr:hypothetical protein DFJ73DRAFT_799709 [Zopfochytrium polystomum]
MPSRRRLPFVTLDVFTHTRFTGNPLAVVYVPPSDGGDGPSGFAGSAADTDAFPLDRATMQTIAKEFNLSETIFLVSDGANDARDEDGSPKSPQWRVRIFLPHSELPFAGHPVIGSAVFALSTLAHGAPRGRFLAKAGPVELSLKASKADDRESDDALGIASAVVPHNFHIHTQQQAHRSSALADLLATHAGLVAADVVSLDLISPVRGVNFLAVRLADVDALGKVSDRKGRPSIVLDEGWTDDGGDGGSFCSTYFYVVESCSLTRTNAEDASTEAAVERRVRLRARMMEGTFEDPATGAAACAIGPFLAVTQLPPSTEAGGADKSAAPCWATGVDIVQGVEMGRRSELRVDVRLTPGLDAIDTVVLSGAAVKVMEGVIEC